MTYYRVASQASQSATWQWKSTVLTSLETVFGFLKLYRMVPKDRIRVFFSSAIQSLDEMLARENQGLASNSLTAEQLFNGGKPILPPEMNQLASERSTGMGRVGTSLLSEQACHEQSMSTLRQESMSLLDMRRLEAELGTSGDHDTSYTFSLPASIPELLSWIRLLARVRRGELEP